MAFVNSIPVGSSIQPTNVTHPSLCETPLTSRTIKPDVIKRATPRMGYGKYSYSTDKTKGHVQQYYVDKFRNATDFIKGTPATPDDAVLGRDVKNAKLIPTEGIPQPIDPILIVGPAPEDPRVAEASGSLYPWDVAYKDPQFAPESYANLDDESVSDTAFAQFRSSLSESRGAALTAMDFGATARVNRLLEGIPESYMLSLDGALDAEYLRLQKLANPPGLNPTGTPQTEIPGTPYLGSVGALDFQRKKETEIAFWKDTVGANAPTLPYKKPSGKDTPDLPYNTSATVNELKETQAARGLLPQQ